MSVIVLRAPVSMSSDYILDCGDILSVPGRDPMLGPASRRDIWCPRCQAWRKVIERTDSADRRPDRPRGNSS